MKKPTHKSPQGCVWTLLVMVIGGIVFSVLQIGTNLPTFLNVAIGLFLGLVITYTFLGKPKLKSVFQSFLLVLFVFLALKTLFGLLIDLWETHSKDMVFTSEEKVLQTTIIDDNDTIPVFSSTRRWTDNYGNLFEGDLTVRVNDYYALKDYIATYRTGTRGNFWGNLYDHIERKDLPSLDLVIRNFERIRAERNLNQMEFAEMVVSCIQDIPYAFVFSEACLPADRYESSIKEILQQCPECCIGNIAYGIQNPVSFIQNLKGDCDTRTVLIYSILKYFQYDVAIANSDFYKHSILAINIPASGLFKVHNGKKYILWETTAAYFQAGYLSPNFADVTHWNIVLTSK
ncbi:hypothetical protein [Altibacter sp.]|uniref:hypothetical protein n=1 Tax=Altibacter sp. TaxID=2024823 RepID=UPI000C95778D|nr:hypothetical protein [Altibacter sp.]MAP53679.1 hypothetical protein [Altibacter sp.]